MTGQRTYTQEGSPSVTAGAAASTSRLVYSKGNVCVHPTTDAKDVMKGFLSIVEKNMTEFYVVWTPNDLLSESDYVNVGSEDFDSASYYSNNSSSLTMSTASNTRTYAITTGLIEAPLCVSEQYALSINAEDLLSLRKFVPSLGISTLTLTTKDGVSFPSFFFHDGGLKEFILVLNQYATLIKSKDDPSILLVNDKSSRLSRTLSELRVSTSHINQQEHDHDTSAVMTKAVQEVSWGILENFSLITRFARDRLFVGGKMVARTLDAEKQRILAEYEKAREHRSMWRTPDLVQEATTPVGVFEILSSNSTTPTLHQIDRTPLNSEIWQEYFLQPDGTVAHIQELKRMIFFGGIERDMRPIVWKYLLGVIPYDATTQVQAELAKKQRVEFAQVKQQWQSILPQQEVYFSKYRDRRHRIEKDVVRTDRDHTLFASEDADALQKLRELLLTYTFYNFDLGYVQGMSDLCSPLLAVLENDADTFWCFTSFMENMRHRFDKDQRGMHMQLELLATLTRVADAQLFQYFENHDNGGMLFCYRWLLVMFKREFPFETVFELWERLWTNYLTPHFHLFVCVAILQKHRETIMQRQLEFDETLKYINDLSMQIDLHETLAMAEALYYRLAAMKNLPADAKELFGPAEQQQ